jgi:hypothetical protein
MSAMCRCAANIFRKLLPEQRFRTERGHAHSGGWSRFVLGLQQARKKTVSGTSRDVARALHATILGL